MRRISALEGQRALLLGLLPASSQARIRARQAEAGEGQGSLKWVFPAPILDESAFRRRVKKQEEEKEADEGALAAVLVKRGKRKCREVE